MKRARNTIPRKSLAFYSMFILVLCGFLILYVWQFTIIVEKKDSIKKLMKKNQELSRKLSQLSLTYDQLSSVSRIEKIAKEKLKMVYPETISFININQNK